MAATGGFVTFRIVHQTQIIVIPQILLKLTFSPESAFGFIFGVVHFLHVLLEWLPCFDLISLII